MAVLLCPLCASEYIDTVRQCVDCHVALIDPADDSDPRKAPDDEQVIYELDRWSLDSRVGIAEVMANSGVAHAWEGEELIIHERDEAAVDRLIAPFDPNDAIAVPIDDFRLSNGIVSDDTGDTDESGADSGPDGSRVAGDVTASQSESDDAATVDVEVSIVEYDLSDWELGERAGLVSSLVEAGVPHKWEGTLLLISEDDESVVDDMLDDLEAGGDEAALEDDGAETPFEVLEALFLAADRLVSDRRSHEGQKYLLTALEGMDEDRPPFGVDLLHWQRIVAIADDLADHVSGETMDLALAEEDAVELRKLLRNYI